MFIKKLTYPFRIIHLYGHWPNPSRSSIINWLEIRYHGSIFKDVPLKKLRRIWRDEQWRTFNGNPNIMCI